ncbi:spore germination protein [Alkalihalobacterium sp. APHAB7]|uniref:spore germination protein n=1 Tax=Alkalihalobacterium sp. APHAB7 TaxID=3402081 RepID=UPI003AAE4131
MKHVKVPKQINQLQHSLENGTLKVNELKQSFQKHSDINFIIKENRNICAFYCAGMIDRSELNEYLNVAFEYATRHYEKMENCTECKGAHEEEEPTINSVCTISEMVEALFSGYVLLYTSNQNYFYSLDISKVPQRTPEQSTTDVALKGPKDAFTEDININISLIRKRIKSLDLLNETFTLGTITKTKVSMLYLDKKINEQIVKEVIHRLENFKGVSLISGGQLEQWISDKTLSLFPLFDYITRADFVVECLLKGRFVLVVDGSPIVIIGPANLFLLLKSPEDLHFPYYFTAFQRILRVFGIIIAIFLPAFWVAVSSVNLSQIPFAFLMTVVLSRAGVPLPLAVETLLVLGLFELLREAGVRMPAAVGQTVSIVGGLIIGDAAIRAGITSPALVVIIALTAVCTYTLVNQSLTGTVSLLRVFMIIPSAFLGVFGFFIGVIAIAIYLCQLESYKMNYLEPVVTLKIKDLLATLLINPFKTKVLTWNELTKRRE